MSKPNPWVLTLFLLAIVAVMGGVSVLKGGIYIAKHEGDTLHLLDIVLRMAGGELPHVNFVTPLGILSFAPISALVWAGFGFGMAFILAQILVALMILPAVAWVGASRLSTAQAYMFGAISLVMPLALVHGQSEQSISLSMHYNRFAWMLSFVAIALAILPSKWLSNQKVDGVIIGLCMGALALLKVTYFVAFAPPILIAMIMRAQYRAIIYSLAAGLAVAAAMTAYGGLGYWGAYLGDLLTVSTSGVRSAPSGELGEVVGAPAYLGATMMLLLSVILLRQARESVGGLVLLLLAPGFVYVTYQNFGNDPQWLWLLAVLLLAFRPTTDIVNGFGWNLRRAMSYTAVAVVMAGAPSFLNLVYSPFRHMTEDPSEFMPILSRWERHSDLQLYKPRALNVNISVRDDGPGQAFEAYFQRAERDPLATIKGEKLAYCTVDLGTVAWMESIAQRLEDTGFAKGNTFFMTDLLPAIWMYSDKINPTPNAAPWYYGGLPGLEQSDYVIVPICPISDRIRKDILDDLNARGTDDLTEVDRNKLYILYRKAK